MTGRPQPVLGVVLAGGASRRMGRDKAELVDGGRTMLARVCDALASADLRVVVVGRTRAPGFVSDADVVFEPDVIADRGPLGGLVTAFQSTEPSSDFLLAACDLPLLSGDVVRWLLRQASSLPDSTHGLIPSLDGRPQYLFAVYRRLVEPLAQVHLSKGRLALRDLVEAGNFASAPVPDRFGGVLRNINTLEDWLALRRERREVDEADSADIKSSSAAQATL